MKFNVILTKEEEGGYSARVPVLDGCFTQGETKEEIMNKIKQLIKSFIKISNEVDRTHLNKNDIVDAINIDL